MGSTTTDLAFPMLEMGVLIRVLHARLRSINQILRPRWLLARPRLQDTQCHPV